MLPVPIAQLLRSQAGIISTRQLLAVGKSPGQVRRLTQRMTRISDGIHLEGDPSWLAATNAGLLRAGDRGVLGTLAAAHLWGLVPDEPRRIEVWTPNARAPMDVGQWRVEFRRGDKRGRGAPRRTDVEETVLDVANQGDEHTAVAILTRALADGRTTGERVLRRLDGRTRQRHRALLSSLCHAEELAGLESVLEYLFHRNVTEAHGLPVPDRQTQRRAGRVDNRYPEYGLLVELDGARHHVDRERDHHRDNEHLLAHDELTLRFGWRNVNDGACTSAEQIVRALSKGGWDGKFRRRTCKCITASGM